jgi:hypothetical protein
MTIRRPAADAAPRAREPRVGEHLAQPRQVCMHERWVARAVSATYAGENVEERTPRTNEIRHGLLALHRAIVTVEKIGYERLHGRMSAGDFLNVLVNAEEFAWLRPLTTLIVQLDEVLDEPGQADVAASVQEIREVLTPAAEGSPFQQRYAQLIQSSPEIALAHASLARLLPR